MEFKTGPTQEDALRLWRTLKQEYKQYANEKQNLEKIRQRNRREALVLKELTNQSKEEEANLKKIASEKESVMKEIKELNEELQQVAYQMLLNNVTTLSADCKERIKEKICEDYEQELMKELKRKIIPKDTPKNRKASPSQLEFVLNHMLSFDEVHELLCKVIVKTQGKLKRRLREKQRQIENNGEKISSAHRCKSKDSKTSDFSVLVDLCEYLAPLMLKKPRPLHLSRYDLGTLGSESEALPVAKTYMQFLGILDEEMHDSWVKYKGYNEEYEKLSKVERMLMKRRFSKEDDDELF